MQSIHKSFRREGIKIIDQYSEKLKKVVLLACDTVPFYKNILAEKRQNFSNDFNKLFESLPVVDKTQYRLKMKDFFSEDIDKQHLITEYTSGSTGEPFVCYKSYKDRLAVLRSVYKHRKSVIPELKITDKMLRFYGSWTPINFDKNTLLLSVFYFNKEKIYEYVETIIKFEPKWIFGTPSAIYNFITVAKSEGIFKGLLNRTEIRYIETTGEILTDSMREFLEKSFGAPVVDHYGCREIWHIAFLCKEGHLHIAEDNTYVEIVNEFGEVVGKEKKGEIVVTGLNNLDIPFIRYAIGDFGLISSQKCSCGSKAPILEIYGGRVTENIILPSGDKISSVFIHHIFRKLESFGLKGILKYFVVQEQINKIIFNLVVNSDYNHIFESEIMKLANSVFRGQLEIEFKYCNELEIGKSGKHKNFISILNREEEKI